MSATTAGALKTLIEAGGLSLAAYRDRAPDAPRPYVTISDGVSITDDRHGDNGNNMAVTELAQVDLWERLKAGNPKDYQGAATDPYEDPALARGLVNLLHGASLPTAPTRVYAVTVDDARRLVEPDTGIVHTAITVRLRRNN